MFGIGSGELVIILGIAFLLFGPTLLAFWLGYVMGQKRVGSPPADEVGQGAEHVDQRASDSAMLPDDEEPIDG